LSRFFIYIYFRTQKQGFAFNLIVPEKDIISHFKI
jgi:hypothetical protein